MCICKCKDFCRNIHLYVLLVSFPKNENHQKGSPRRGWQFPAYNVAPQNWHGSTKQKAVTENHQKRNERITTERLAASSIQHRTSERAWLNKTKRSIIKSMTSTHDLRKRYLAQKCGLARNHFSILSICSVGGLCALWHCTLKSVFPDHWGNPRR